MPRKRQAVIDAESYHRFHLNEAARLRSLTPFITTTAARVRVLEQAEEHAQRAAELLETEGVEIEEANEMRGSTRNFQAYRTQYQSQHQHTGAGWHQQIPHHRKKVKVQEERQQSTHDADVLEIEQAQ